MDSLEPYISRANSPYFSYIQDYCDKAEVTVDISSMDGSRTTSFRCFEVAEGGNPCSSKVCEGRLYGIHSGGDQAEEVTVQLCTDQDADYLGAIWEVNFSTSNDSHEVMAEFEEAARERFRSATTRGATPK